MNTKQLLLISLTVVGFGYVSSNMASAISTKEVSLVNKSKWGSREFKISENILKSSEDKVIAKEEVKAGEKLLLKLPCCDKPIRISVIYCSYPGHSEHDQHLGYIVIEPDLLKTLRSLEYGGEEWEARRHYDILTKATFILNKGEQQTVLELKKRKEERKL